MPLSPLTFTVAEAAKKANYSTIHIGVRRKPGLTIMVEYFALFTASEEGKLLRATRDKTWLGMPLQQLL